MAMLMRKSGGRGRRGSGSMADINVTPMVDVMLVLLIVFMITAPMLATGVTVALPKVQAPQLDTPNQRPLVVTVDKKGQVYLGLEDTKIELKDLAPKLKLLAENNLEKKIYVRGDAGVSYEQVMTVLSLLQSSGFTKVGLPVDPNAARRILQGG